MDHLSPRLEVFSGCGSMRLLIWRATVKLLTKKLYITKEKWISSLEIGRMILNVSLQRKWNIKKNGRKVSDFKQIKKNRNTELRAESNANSLMHTFIVPRIDHPDYWFFYTCKVLVISVRILYGYKLNMIMNLHFFTFSIFVIFWLTHQYFIDSAFVSCGPIVIARPPKTE